MENRPDNTEDVKSSKITPTDGRKEGYWQSRYPKEAQKEINWEKKYVVFLMLTMAFLGIAMGIQCKCHSVDHPFMLSHKFHSFFFAWLGGTLGGLVFAGKWLYHSVANGFWNLDRRLWRILTPHLSGTLALVIVVIFSSDMLQTNQTFSIFKSCGIGFLVGYFSDNAIGKLSELANVFFAKNG